MHIQATVFEGPIDSASPAGLPFRSVGIEYSPG
jgi:hypothetical protein